MEKKSSNKNLRSANKAKNDEFYTQLSDIEKEVKNYKEHFKDKVVFLNCDDPEESNFWKFFSEKFEILELKSLVATHFEKEKPSYKLEIIKDVNKDGKLNKLDTVKTVLKQNGDFRSPECIEILKSADIVVTNPPFSLFREYVAQLVEYDKNFLIIGSQNAITYKEIFKLVKENKIWLGCAFPKEFVQPDKTVKKFGNICWYTNLDTTKRHEDIILTNSYDRKNLKYKMYENYEAINIDRIKDVPKDYNGFLGVPITFLNNYNPEQFEIVGLGISNSGVDIGVRPYTPEHKKYRKEIQKRGAVDGDLYMMIDGVVTVPYARVIIRNKKV